MKRIWIPVAGVVGIGLALLLIPRPDTGGDVPEADLGSVEGPTTFVNPKEARAAARAKAREEREAAAARGEPVAPAPSSEPGGPDPLGLQERRVRPEVAERQHQRLRPEYVMANKTSTPWTVARGEIGISQPADAGRERLLEDIDLLLSDLEVIKQDPNKWDWATIEARQRNLMTSVERSGRMTDDIRSAFGTLNQHLGSYGEAQKAWEEAEAARATAAP